MATTFRLNATLRVSGVQSQGLRIEVHDRSGICPDLVEVAVPDALGRFTVELDEPYLRQVFAERRPPLYFRIFEGERPLASTETAAVWRLANPSTELRIAVAPDAKGDGRTAPYVVRGRVHASDLGEGWRIRAIDRGLGGADEILAEVPVDAHGAYEARYTWEQLGRRGKHHADLLLKVIDARGAERYTSDCICRARPALVADLVLDMSAARGPSTWVRLSRALEPRLGHATVASLTDDEVGCLSESLGMSRIYLDRFVTAHRLAERLAGQRAQLPPALCFALLAEGTQPSLPALRRMRGSQIRRRVARAVDHNHVGQANAGQLDAWVGELRTWASRTSLSDSTLGSVIARGVGPEAASRFLEAWFDHDGDAPEFWRTISTRGGLEAGLVSRIQLTLRLGVLTGAHLPLLESLLQRGVGGVADLARLTGGEWSELVARAGVPAGIPGPDEAARREAYARLLAHKVEAAAPTAVLAARLEESPREEDTPVRAFLKANPSFAFGSGSVRRYLVQNPRALDGLGSAAEVVAALHRTQRLYRLTEGPDRLAAIRALSDAGLHSATRIARVSRQAFLARHGEALGGHEQAARVYAKALNTAARAQVVVAAYRNDAASTIPWALGTRNPPLQLIKPVPQAALPDWATMFGSVDFCTCEHCRSVLSPSAYLVDLLLFLEDRPGPGAAETFYTRVARRRPDIPLVELTCQNTNTVLPTIDVVNEVLEHAVASGLPAAERGDRLVPWLDEPVPTAGDVPAGRQTAGLAEDLALHPEHQCDPAYGVLAAASYPWQLPFDLGDEEVRAYLPLVALTRQRLLEVLRGGDPTVPLDAARRHAQAREQLGMTPEEWDIVGAVVTSNPAAWWGHPSPKWNWGQVAHVAGTDATVDGASVESVLDRAGLEYAQLDDVLRSQFVNPDLPANDPWRIEILLAEGTCDLSQARIGTRRTDLTSHAVQDRAHLVLGRLHRFVRLQRRLGWTAYELDKAIGAFTPASPGEPLPPEAVARIAELDRLRRDLRVGVVEAVTWWASLPTDSPDDETPSFYDRLFQNPGVQNPVDENFALDATRTELAHAADPALAIATLEPTSAGGYGAETVRELGATSETLAGALRVSTEVLRALLGAVDLATSGSDPRTVPLGLSNLSRLYRVVSLARAIKLSVPDLLTLRRFHDVDPFTSPSEALRFAVEVAAARTARLKLPDVDMLVRYPVLWPDDNAVGATLREVRGQLVRTVEETTPATDADGQRLTTLLAGILPDNVTVEIAPPAPPGAPAEPFTFTRDDAADRIVTLVAGAAADDVAAWTAEQASAESGTSAVLRRDVTWALLTSPEGMASWIPANAQASLFDPTWLPAPSDFDPTLGPPGTTRFEYVQGLLLRTLRATLAPTRVIEVLGAAAGLPGDVASELLQVYLHVDLAGGTFDPPLTASDPAYKVFLDEAFSGSADPEWPAGTPDPLPAGFPVQARALRELHSIGRVIGALGITLGDLPVLTSTGVAQGWLDLDDLPTSEVTDAARLRELYTAWTRLRDVYRLRADLGGATGPLFGMLQAAQSRPSGDVSAEWAGDAASPGIRREQILDVLVDVAGWPASDLDFLVGPDGLDLTTPERWKDERWWARLLDAVRLVQRSGLAAEQLADLARRPPQVQGRLDQARALKQAVRAKYPDSNWASAARPVRDVLREKQRSALVAYLLSEGVPAAPAGRRIKSERELYRYLLVDVEMGACATTSRVREALNAVQLFVQQSMIGLETDQPLLDFSTEDHDRWEWMDRYRVWEANRKVFLWPENWMEPELRDDKSPFYEELETQLLQEEVTADSAERAYLAYLQKLDQVARLDVRGTCRELETEDGLTTVDRLHVFGRTRVTPHLYFQRSFENETWGPWQRIDVDIQGDHLLPVVWNRRLYLFWPVFTERAVTSSATTNVPDPGDTGVPVETARTDLDVQLAWTQFVNGKWSAKQTSDVVYSYEYWSQALVEFAHLKWHEDEDNGDLVIVLMGGFGEGHARVRVKGSDGLMVSSAIDKASMRLAIPEDEDTGDMIFFQYQEYVPANESTLVLPVDRSDWNEADVILREAPTDFDVVPILPYTPPADLELPSFFYDDARRSFWIRPQDNYASWDDLTLSEPGSSLTGRPDEIDPSVYQPLPDPEEVKGGLWADLTGGTYAPPPPAPATGLYVGGYAPYTAPLATMDVATRVDPKEGIQAREVADATFQATFWHDRTFVFRPFYHPYVKSFMRQLNRFGVDGLLSPAPEAGADGSTDEIRYLLRQGQGIKVGPRGWKFDDPGADEDYDPTKRVEKPYPVEDIDFAIDGAYALYNWELFFHAPLEIAVKLSQNQRFEDAQQWFHYIFDPTDTPTAGEKTPQRFWKVKPLYNLYFQDDPEAASIDRILYWFAGGGTAEEQAAARAALAGADGQITTWQDNPFNPYAIARLRWAAFQKTVFLKYLDNLMAWGDSLFRQYTTESVNEATLIYVLAAELLGERPQEVETQDPEPLCYADRRGTWDDFANVLVEVEDALAADPTPSHWDDPPVLQTPTLFFCVPPNENLLSYWDTVEDRLFKIHHCLDIDGFARPLALFDPPIDPAALVRAVAGGGGVAGALAGLYAPLPFQRYVVLAQRANELCNDVKGLGATLLSALEKRDAEALALLRSSHELAVLDAVKAVRKQQVDEAATAKEALDLSKAVVQRRIDEYTARLAEGDGTGLNPREVAQAASLDDALDKLEPTPQIQMGVGTVALLPTLNIGIAGFGGSPEVGVTWGAGNLMGAAQAADQALQHWAAIHSHEASMSGIAASHERSKQEWQLQLDLATRELTHLAKQADAADLHRQIAERELANQERQIEHAQETEAFLRDKFTNRQLYDWMVTRISATYFQAYQLALDMARKAERAWQYEVAAPSPPTFIHSDNWDSLRKGLLAGERLQLDLRRMDAAWLDQARRDYELSRAFSMAQVDPVALQGLKATGKCEVTLPEALFDLDCPGHYMRRIKTVAVSVPCVAGPFAPVHCTLTLLGSVVRSKPSLDTAGDDPYGSPNPDDDRFRFMQGAVQAVVTSTGQQDSGLFETVLKDERFLPFEGQGAAESRWRIELPAAFRAFDYDTIADVVIHLRYTAREGGSALRDAATAALEARCRAMVADADGLSLTRVLSLRTESAAEWNALLTAGTQAMNVSLASDRFPYAFRRFGTIELVAADLFLFGIEGVSGDPGTLGFDLRCTEREDGGNVSEAPVALFSMSRLMSSDDRVLHARHVWVAADGDLPAPTGSWRLSVTGVSSGSAWATDDAPPRLAGDRVRHAYLVVTYRVGA